MQDSTNNENQEIKSSWFTIPYIPSFTDKFKRFNNKDLKVFFFSLNKLNKFIKVWKDSRPQSTKNNVVHKIECKDCNLSYVGQTGRQLNTRIKELRNIRSNTSTRSVITDHRMQSEHDFDWDNVKILEEEPCYGKRLISEMIHIKKQENRLNLQNDREGLHKSYLSIISRI